MKNFTFARPYAKAAYFYAKEKGTVEPWFNFLGQLATLFAEPEMQNMLQNPQLPAHTLIEIIIANISPKLDAGMQNFLKEVMQQQRLGYLPEMVELFIDDWQKDRQMCVVTVTSAMVLSAAELTQLEKDLKHQFKQPVSVTVQIDASLIGGLIIQSGDYVVDGSLKGQLNRLKYSLRK